MRNCIIALLLACLSVGYAVGQNNNIDSLRSQFDEMYGLNVLLYNGRKFFPDNNPAIGFPYLQSQDSFQADLTIEGKKFKDRRVKYNLVKQEFILFYQDYNGQPKQIILNESAIDTIKMDGRVFIQNKFTKINQDFIQIIYGGKLSCYIGHYKNFQYKTTGTDVGYEYSKVYHDYYLVIDDEVHPFKNKRTLVRIFPKGKRSLIKKYISLQHIRFKRISDQELKRIIMYCEEIE